MKLRLLATSDLAIRVEWMNNPNVYKTMHFVPPISLEKTIEWYSKNKKIDSRCDVAFEDDNGQLIAMGGLTAIDFTVRKAEFYIFVNPNRQREGIGTEATYLLCKYGFEVLDLHKIYLYTNSSNIGARHTYEKIGFTLEGIHRNEMIADEKYEDRLYYGLLSTELAKEQYQLNFTGNSDIIIEKYKICDREISIVRDDLFPKLGGGVKARKSICYEQFMLNNGYNACVTTGGIQSNHNRAIALMCSRHNWKCYLVYHGTKKRFKSEGGNALLVRKSGAETEFVDAEDIGPSMDAAMEKLRQQGLKPLYIHGGGHDISGGIALVEAVKSLKKKCEILDYKPKYIFHASGTGSTQAGIAVGLDLVGWSDVKLVGISVARQKNRGQQVIEEFANRLAHHFGINKDYQGKIEFNTDYLCGGYEKYTIEMTEFLDNIMKKTGVIFDTTYSGKAFYGMFDILKRKNIKDSVLFWHTGGLMNFLK